MKNFGYKILIIFGITLLLSSCMMMGPGHHTMPYYEQQGSYIDPVCGHQIDTVSKDLSLQYEGREYFFHTDACMKSFKDNPGHYLTPNRRSPNYFLWGMGSIGMAAMMVLMIL